MDGRKGRPPKDPTQPQGAKYHLGLRLDDVRKAKLAALVRDANARARDARLPTDITPSSLVRSWIVATIDAEYDALQEASISAGGLPKRKS